MIANVFQESKIFQKTMFVFTYTIYFTYNTEETFFCLTQADILSSTSNFFATIAALWKNMWPPVKIITKVYAFRLRHPL